MSRINWRHIVAFVGIVVVIFVLGLMLLPLFFGWSGGWWPMGPGMMGGQRQGGWCPFCGSGGRYPGWGFGGVFGWIFMLGAMLFPLGVLALLILGVVWLVRGSSRPRGSAPEAPRGCPECGKPVAGDWHHCPECGHGLDGDG